MRFRPHLASLPLLALAACGSSLAGGSGTETGNALTVLARTALGAPAVGAIVEAWPAEQIPATQGTAPTSRDTTDATGAAKLELSEGSWSVLVRQGGAAFQLRTQAEGEVIDTLRPMAHLSGTIQGGSGARIALIGLGRSVSCDSNGFFQLDSLPSGTLSLAVVRSGIAVASEVSLPAGGASSILIQDSAAKGDSVVTTYTRDSLAGSSLPYSLAKASLGDTGAFALAAQLTRDPAVDTAWMLSWTGNSGNGIRLGWFGSDTLALEVDGTLHKIAGIAFGSAPRTAGLVWTGSHLEAYLDTGRIVSLTTASPASRSSWSDPIIGASGISAAAWVATKRGVLPEGWFAKLDR